LIILTGNHDSKKKFRKYKQHKSRYNSRNQYKSRPNSRRNWRLRKLLLSLKLWFLVFCAVVVVVAIMERGNTLQFYLNTPDSVKYALYLFASGVGILAGYKVFDRCDYNPRSDRGLFSLKLLSGGIFIASIFIIGFAFDLLLFTGLSAQVQSILSDQMISAFLIALAFTLLVTSSYLLFKFQRRSGVIVYRG
jgi:hypothetical protein